MCRPSLVAHTEDTLPVRHTRNTECLLLVFRRVPFEARLGHRLPLLTKIPVAFHNASRKNAGHYRYLILDQDHFIPKHLPLFNDDHSIQHYTLLVFDSVLKLTIHKIYWKQKNEMLSKVTHNHESNQCRRRSTV